MCNNCKERLKTATNGRNDCKETHKETKQSKVNPGNAFNLNLLNPFWQDVAWVHLPVRPGVTFGCFNLFIALKKE